MADQRDDWRRDRDRSYGYGEERERARRDEHERGRYGRPEYGGGEGGRRDPENDWRRDRGDSGRGYSAGGGWDRAQREGQGRGYQRAGGRGDYGQRDYGQRDYGQRDYGREEWGRGYGSNTGPTEGIRRATGGVPGGNWGFDEGRGRDRGGNQGWESTGYGRPGYNRDRPGEREDYPDRSRDDRGWWDRASDEVSSWFGDAPAERRRENDEGGRDHHRGRGPRGYTRSDERIREDVSDRLTDNPILDATEIEVTVSSGEVTLSGNVDSRYSKRLAEDLTDEVSGVRHVQNNLRVRQTQPYREFDLRHLLRHRRGRQHLRCRTHWRPRRHRIRRRQQPGRQQIRQRRYFGPRRNDDTTLSGGRDPPVPLCLPLPLRATQFTDHRQEGDSPSPCGRGSGEGFRPVNAYNVAASLRSPRAGECGVRWPARHTDPHNPPPCAWH